MLHENFIISLVNGHANMSDMMCRDSFVGHGMSHGSHVHSRVHIRVRIANHDTIEDGMTWHDMDKNLIMFSHDSCRNVLNHEVS